MFVFSILDADIATSSMKTLFRNGTYKYNNDLMQWTEQIHEHTVAMSELYIVKLWNKTEIYLK